MFISHANLYVPDPFSVATTALSLVPKTVHPARSPAETPANTVNARRNAVNLANPAMSRASGNVSITNAPSYASSLAIVSVVINLAENASLASIYALVFAGKSAPRNAASVTRTKSQRFSSEPKRTRMHDSWS